MRDKPTHTYDTRELFCRLNAIRLFYASLSEAEKKVFIDSLEEHPAVGILLDKHFDVKNLINFSGSHNYFLYLPTQNNRKAYLIQKEDINSIIRNIKIALEFDMCTCNHYRLN